MTTESEGTSLTTNNDNKKLSELIGNNIRNKNGKLISVDNELSKNNDVIGLYFSAHWCGPCRNFTPKLKNAYNKWKNEKNLKFEIIFVSRDTSQSAFENYYNNDHGNWLIIPYNDKNRINKLCKLNNSGGIPCLVMINAKNGDIITENGRNIVNDDPNGYQFPWNDYKPAYKPPNVLYRVVIRLIMFAAIFIFFKYYK